MADITCPKCKSIVPKVPICSKCGFDMKSYFLTRKQKQPANIKCPKCKKTVSKKPICPECGFDIRAYYTNLGQKQSDAVEVASSKNKALASSKRNKKIAVAGVLIISLVAIASVAAFLLMGGREEVSLEEAYLGCYTDQGDPQGLDGRDMSGSWTNNANMTIEECVSDCMSKGYSYAGLQYSSHCFCGNDYGASGTSQNCNMECSGDSSQICGGPWANSVYKVVPLISASSKPKITDGVGDRSSQERPAETKTKRAQKSVSWDDPQGDVYAFEKANKPFVDMVGASANSKDGYLILEAIANEDFEHYFSFTNKDGFRFGYRPVSFFIDTDNNPDSGGVPERLGDDSGEIGGYSHHVKVFLGFLVKHEGTDKPSFDYGDLKFAPDEQIIRGAATYWLERAAGQDYWEEVRRNPGDRDSNFDDLASLDGNKVILKVPYELLGVDKGQTIRLCFKEQGQDGREIDKFSANKELLLK